MRSPPARWSLSIVAGHLLAVRQPHTTVRPSVVEPKPDAMQDSVRAEISPWSNGMKTIDSKTGVSLAKHCLLIFATAYGIVHSASLVRPTLNAAASVRSKTERI